MAMLRFGKAAVTKPSIHASDWANTVYKSATKNGGGTMKTAKSIVAKYSPDKHLLSHCTIIAAVDTDLADPKDQKSKYLIKPEFSDFVNNNGDAWTKNVLKNSFHTFIGGDNFLEHVQQKVLSKGRIIDAVLREIPVGKDKEGNDLTTYYCDILVATDRKHTDLIRKIESGELTTLSMGCKIAFSICSKCGNKAVDETEACDHVKYQKNNTFFDSNGLQRKIAELCGDDETPGSVRFIEASWVAQPAFTGAVLRSFVAPSEQILAKLEKASSMPQFEKEQGDFLKAANLSDIVAAEPEPDTEDVPAEDPTADPSLDDAGADAPTGAPAEEVAPEDQFKNWKDDLKKKVLQQITDEVTQNLSDEEETSRGTDSLDETLIRPASAALKKVYGSTKALDTYIKSRVGSISKKSFNKLRYGIHIATTSDDLTSLKDYGYGKRDLLAVLSFIDGCMKEQLPIEAQKVIATLGGLTGKTPREVLKPVVAAVGRKVTQKEAHKILSWLKLMDYFG